MNEPPVTTYLAINDYGDIQLHRNLYIMSCTFYIGIFWCVWNYV